MSVERCPVCHGKGWMPQSFYSPFGQPVVETTSMGPPTESCRSCGGKGVIICPDITPPIQYRSVGGVLELIE